MKIVKISYATMYFVWEKFLKFLENVFSIEKFCEFYLLLDGECVFCGNVNFTHIFVNFMGKTVVVNFSGSRWWCSDIFFFFFFYYIT